MPSKKVETWVQQYQAQGYRNPPGEPVLRSGEELLREDVDEVTLGKGEVETIVPGSTRVGHHDGHARCSLLEYGSGVLRVTFSHGVRTYRISEDQWESLKSAAPSSPGRWIDANLPR
jgi:hypothetical protein